MMNETKYKLIKDVEQLVDVDKQILRALSSFESINGQSIDLTRLTKGINGERVHLESKKALKTKEVRERLNILIAKGYALYTERRGHQDFYEITEEGNYLAKKVRTPEQQKEYDVNKPALRIKEFGEMMSGRYG